MKPLFRTFLRSCCHVEHLPSLDDILKIVLIKGNKKSPADCVEKMFRLDSCTFQEKRGNFLKMKTEEKRKEKRNKMRRKRQLKL